MKAMPVPKKSRSSSKPIDKPIKDTAFLEALQPAEAALVLQRLLAAHPELRSEAVEIARAALGEVSVAAVADEVAGAILQLDYGDLNGRAGRHSWGYVGPADAAQELLEEAIDPCTDELRRYLKLGLEKEALETCLGILLGLYRLREGAENDVVNWAPDFPAEAAGDVLDEWLKEGGNRRAIFPRDFVSQHIPAWQWIAKRIDSSAE